MDLLYGTLGAAALLSIKGFDTASEEVIIYMNGAGMPASSAISSPNVRARVTVFDSN